MADGVPMDKLYPLDIDRAFAKFDTIKGEIIWWDTNSQSQQLFIDGEVNLGLILNGRAYDAAKKGAPIAVEWNGNVQSVDYFVVLKGAANTDVAMRFIQFASQPEGQHHGERNRLRADQSGRAEAGRSKGRALAFDDSGRSRKRHLDRRLVLARQSQERQ